MLVKLDNINIFKWYNSPILQDILQDVVPGISKQIQIVGRIRCLRFLCQLPWNRNCSASSDHTFAVWQSNLFGNRHVSDRWQTLKCHQRVQQDLTIDTRESFVFTGQDSEYWIVFHNENKTTIVRTVRDVSFLFNLDHLSFYQEQSEETIQIYRRPYID